MVMMMVVVAVVTDGPNSNLYYFVKIGCISRKNAFFRSRCGFSSFGSGPSTHPSCAIEQTMNDETAMMMMIIVQPRFDWWLQTSDCR
jgi:hypothetical protein